MQRELARRSLVAFAREVCPGLSLGGFHDKIYTLLEHFAKGHLKKLIVTLPPQHGKTLAASNLLPAYLLGLDPDLKIGIGAYSATYARKINTGLQRIIDQPAYRQLFAATRLKGPGDNPQLHVRNKNQFDIVDRKGCVRVVGRGSALTGHSVDVMILDDVYKNAMEAHSPVVRENAWDWYVSVVRSRLHNDSRELIAFTRWHEEDLVGRILQSEPVLDAALASMEELMAWDGWVAINFPALQNTAPTPCDPRTYGEPLWPLRHARKALEEKKRLDPLAFESLYQGNPAPEGNRLYREFETYRDLPPSIRYRANYTDTADSGDDRMCSVCYQVDAAGLCYITDVLYSEEEMIDSEQKVARMLARNDCSVAYIESNNGGKGFARTLEGMAAPTRIVPFYQSLNKEARILSNAYAVGRFVRMPENWKNRWPDFARDLIAFRRNFKSNRYDDAPDVLTGIIEKECYPDEKPRKKIRTVQFAV